MSDPDWRKLNRANWDERVPIHLAAPIYDPVPLRAGLAKMNAIEEAELGPINGLRLLHLQCHFGRDTLILAQRGATVVGLDFSPPAIVAARALAGQLGLADRARFVEADLYDAPHAIPEPGSFDRVYVTWGALCWLPDIAEWARIVAYFLKPGGSLYLAEGHPAALVLDDAVPLPNGLPGFFVPYFHSDPLVLDDARDYADLNARLANARTCEWIHPLGAVVTALISAGLRLDWLHEHDAITWRMFMCLTEGSDGLYRWPDTPWLPLAYSLWATRPDPGINTA
ncbi:MAG TPA: class I SAM-dependent methyltransferase [Acetobacteraceae bacterium]|jgi:SAM-dependent methyltransferase|nr:class I SAM-dependent methyltransferase [Acetobacteraceae bacterium]